MEAAGESCHPPPLKTHYQPRWQWNCHSEKRVGATSSTLKMKIEMGRRGWPHDGIKGLKRGGLMQRPFSLKRGIFSCREPALGCLRGKWRMQTFSKRLFVKEGHESTNKELLRGLSAWNIALETMLQCKPGMWILYESCHVCVVDEYQTEHQLRYMDGNQVNDFGSLTTFYMALDELFKKKTKLEPVWGGWLVSL